MNSTQHNIDLLNVIDASLHSLFMMSSKHYAGLNCNIINIASVFCEDHKLQRIISVSGSQT
jgi:hypothetical protein